MKKVIYVTALLAIAIYLARQVTHSATAVHENVLAPSALPEQARTKAVTLEAVTMQGCPPCKRLKKETIPTLVMMGYQVTITNRTTDTRGTTWFPTLYYLDAKGNVVLKHVGFQTAAEVIKNLRKL